MWVIINLGPFTEYVATDSGAGGTSIGPKSTQEKYLLKIRHFEREVKFGKEKSNLSTTFNKIQLSSELQLLKIFEITKS